MIHYSAFYDFSFKELIKLAKEQVRCLLKSKQYIDVDATTVEFKLRQNKPLLVIDCRKSHTFNEIGHIPGAVNYPAETFMEQYESIPNDTQIAVVCYFGFYCQVASQLLAEAGHKNVLCMKGGMEKWIASGKAIERIAG